jgi:hypothetical protein
MRAHLLAACVALAALAGCGGDDPEPAAEQAPAAAATDLGPIKDYLLDHTSRLQGDTAKLSSQADRYYALAKSVGFDYAALLAEHRDEAAGLIEQMQQTYVDANPAYEEMEGVVAGVPELADFDVIIDARRPPARRSSSPATSSSSSRPRCGGPSRSSPPRASSPTSTATARPRSARPSPTPTSSSPRRRTSRPTRRTSTPRRRRGSRPSRTRSPRSS